MGTALPPSIRFRAIALKSPHQIFGDLLPAVGKPFLPLESLLILSSATGILLPGFLFLQINLRTVGALLDYFVSTVASRCIVEFESSIRLSSRDC